MNFKKSLCLSLPKGVWINKSFSLYWNYNCGAVCNKRSSRYLTMNLLQSVCGDEARVANGDTATGDAYASWGVDLGDSNPLVGLDTDTCVDVFVNSPSSFSSETETKL